MFEVQKVLVMALGALRVPKVVDDINDGYLGPTKFLSSRIICVE